MINIILNTDKFKDKKFFIILGKDIYIKNDIRKIIIKNIYEYKKYYKKYIYISNILEYYNFIIKYIKSYNIFETKYIFIINYNYKNFLILKKFNNIDFSKNNNYFILIVNNYFINFKKYINLFNKNFFIIDCIINNLEKFIKILELLYIKLKNINKIKIYKWLYIIYNENINIIINIIKIFNKNFNNILNIIINKKIIKYINNFSWIYYMLKSDLKLSNVNLIIIKKNNKFRINDILYLIIKYIKILMFFKINKNYFNNEFLKKNDINLKYKSIIFNSFNKLNILTIYKILKIIININNNILNYKYNDYCINYSWNNLFLITYIYIKN